MAKLTCSAAVARLWHYVRSYLIIFEPNGVPDRIFVWLKLPKYVPTFEYPVVCIAKLTSFAAVARLRNVVLYFIKV